MASDTPVKPKTGLSLYANLLDPTSKDAPTPGTISRAPVVFKQPGGDESRNEENAPPKQQISAAALRFQPTKRPPPANHKTGHKPIQAKAVHHVPPVTSTSTPPEAQAASQRNLQKTTIADWTGDGDEDDVNGFYGEKRQRGGRKKRKKNKGDTHIPQNWDDIYDPSRPNNYEEYRHSDEQLREIREWKDRLYAHKMTGRSDTYSDSEDDGYRRPQMSNQFAPPPMSFAPPPEPQESPPPPPPPPPANVPNDATGEDAYARRMRLSQQQNPSGPPPPPLPPSFTQPSSTISRAPVRYSLPAPPEDIPKSEAELESALQEEEEATDAEPTTEDGPRSLRPGQKGFAARLMSKYGWTQGTGLGANNSGIVNALRVQVEKQKKRPDAEGGGFVGPGGRGKIIGGKKNPGEEEGKFGSMSNVIVLRGMIDGLDLDQELGEGNLMQEIGEECGEKYGRVERVYIDRSSREHPPVFIHFTSQLSALRAVNALEGRNFSGNTITAKFFDGDKFERGIYS